MNAADKVKAGFEERVQLLSETADLLTPSIVTAADMAAGALLNERKILSCGNGISAACAQMFSAIMINRLEMERPGLPAVALTSDTVSLTSIAHDYQFADIFSKQIRALGQTGDVLLALSYNGTSHDVVQAIDAAHDRGMHVLALTGRDGGSITELIRDDDLEIRAPSWNITYIHEIHMAVMLTICDLIDRRLLGEED